MIFKYIIIHKLEKDDHQDKDGQLYGYILEL